MFDVENLPPELFLLSGTRLCMGFTSTSAGGVGTFAIHLLRVNVGTGILATLYDVVAHSAGTIVNLGPTQNSGTPGGVRAFRDLRVFGEGTAAVLHQDTDSLVTGSTFLRQHINQSDEVIVDMKHGLAVISPGNAFSVSDGNGNLDFNVSWLWIEREAQPSELNL